MGLFERAARANAMHADLFISIHHDFVPDNLLQTWQYDGQQNHFNDDYPGLRHLHSDDNADRAGSLMFGRLLGEELQARGLQYTPHYTLPLMGHRRRELVDAKAGVYRYDELVVLRMTHMPAVLLEAGSIVNRQEELELASPERRALTSAAIVAAVEDFCAARASVREGGAKRSKKRAGICIAHSTSDRETLTPCTVWLRAQRQRADDHEVHHIDAEAGGEGRRVEAEIVVQHAGDPTAARHAEAAAQQQRRHAPIGFVDREHLARRQHIGGNEAAEAHAEQRRYGEQAGFVLGDEESRHTERLAGRSDQHRVEAADPVGNHAPKLPAEECRAEQHRHHGRAMRGTDAQIAAERHEMRLAASTSECSR